MKKIINKYITSIFIIISLLIINTTCISAYGNINFQDITTIDGLPQGTVETMIQSKKGYMWFGTNDGLCRYNGYEFKVYKYDEESENSIVNNYIVDIEQDNLGNIWVGTANGLSKINHDNGLITNYNHSEEEQAISHYNICDILVTKSGDVLIATLNGLNIYDFNKDKFYRIFEKEKDLNSQSVYSLTEDGDENIWVATSGGIDKIDIKNKKKILSFKKGKEKSNLSEEEIYVLSYDPNGYIWSGTYKGGLNRINLKTNEIKKYKHNSKNDKSLGGNLVRDILRDKYGNLWIGTENGLSLYDEKTESFTTYKNKLYDKTSLVNNEIFSIIEDRSGLIWVGTYSGISIFDPTSNIKHYKKDPFNKNSISDNAIHGIYEDDEGLLWVGTNSQGVNIINRKTNEIAYLNKDSKKHPLSDDNITDIVGVDNKIFISTKKGLNEFNKDTQTLTIYNKEKYNIPSNIITCLFVDSKKNLWIGTSHGISILDTTTNKIIDITNELTKNNIVDKYIRAIYEDSKGNYWIGCFVNGGLVKINQNKKIIENYRHEKSDKSSISSNNIRSIVEDKNGNIYIGTSYGLNKLDITNNTFKRYTEKDGLSNNTVYGVLVDDDNNLWASTNLGISKLNTKTNTFETFNVLDGLQDNEFNGRAYYKNKNGELFFGGINGLNIFKPKDMNRISQLPEVIFEGFKTNKGIYEDINGKIFKYNENTINVNVFVPNFKNTRNMQYLFKLEGINNEWDVSRSNNIIYSDLKPGNYILKVKARGYSGKLSDERIVKFTIKKPFWKSNLAILLYAILIILIIYKTKARMKCLDNLVKKKTLRLTEEMQKNTDLLNKVIDLEKRKNNYFINLSHELRTPLNVILSTQQLIVEKNKAKDDLNKVKLNEYMEVIKRNSNRLLNLINNLIDTTKLESGMYNLNIKENDIVYIVEEATLSLKEYIERKGIELIIDPEMEEKIIMCDSYEIERCIVNIVSNAAKFTPKGGKIEVNIKELNDNVMITIKDSGIGIDKQYHESIFNRFNQIVDENSETKGGSGLGLTISKQIIDIHGGEIYVESEVNKGSTFSIIL